jgi:hypothetical protein
MIVHRRPPSSSGDEIALARVVVGGGLAKSGLTLI